MSAVHCSRSQLPKQHVQQCVPCPVMLAEWQILLSVAVLSFLPNWHWRIGLDQRFQQEIWNITSKTALVKARPRLEPEVLIPGSPVTLLIPWQLCTSGLISSRLLCWLPVNQLMAGGGAMAAGAHAIYALVQGPGEYRSCPWKQLLTILFMRPSFRFFFSFFLNDYSSFLAYGPEKGHWLTPYVLSLPSCLVDLVQDATLYLLTWSRSNCYLEEHSTQFASKGYSCLASSKLRVQTLVP
jgi:hypothetical protein